MKRFWPLTLLLLLGGILLLRPRRAAPPRPVSAAPAVDVPTDPASVRGGPFWPKESAAAEPAPHPEPPTETAPETEDAVLSSLKWLLNHQNEDGTWGDVPVMLDGHTLGPAGLTGLALLTFLGAGYSHLSKDTYDGKCMGDAVRRTLQWLMNDQRPDGTFCSSRDGSYDQALATLAMSEAYGLTGSNLFKDQAQRAVDGLARLQGRDGSWGGPAPTVWAAEALYSAEVSGLELPRNVYEGLLGYYAAARSERPDAREMFARILLEKKKDNPRLADGADLLSRRHPDWSEQDFSYWYHGSMALFQYDGPSGPRWKTWNESMKNTLVRTETREGTWPGGTLSHTVLRTSLAQLTLEVYYRMANVFGTR